ncbi:hypothetical protein WJX72_005759 [[Myrmecia] bisecta]|uniref:Uncharacterized protein n=1 Tax=[Myrmecia] bisecta TaxID=41462 RepID=A0AAW1R7B1_9CHLO
MDMPKALRKGLCLAVRALRPPHAGASVLWLTRAVQAGEEVTRDHLPGNKSLQRAEALLELLGPRGTAGPRHRSFKRQGGFRSSGFAMADNREKADIIFTHLPVTDFYGLQSHQLVNQFPYGGCIIRKDLLPQTLRRLQSTLNLAETPADGGPASWHPAWFPPTYDLATEVHHFLADFNQRASDNWWVVKLAQGSRSSDVCLTNSPTTAVRYRGAPGGDWVVQKYVHQPVLYQGRKFDLRVNLLVRSFHPLEAFLYTNWYGRMAVEQYSHGRATETDYEKHFTVVSYGEDPAKRAQQLMVRKAEMLQDMQEQGLNVDDLDAQLCNMEHAAALSGRPRDR